MTARTDSLSEDAKRHSVAGLALVLLAAASVHILLGGESVLTSLGETVMAVFLSGVFLVVGFRVARRATTEQIVETVLPRALLGVAVLLVLSLVEGYMLLSAGVESDFVIDIVIGGVALGGIGGVGLGYYELRLRENSWMAEIARTALNATSDGVAVLDDDLRYVAMNPAYAALQGYDAEDELIGEHFRPLQVEDRNDYFEREILPTVATEGEWSGEVTSRRRSGEEFVEAMSLNALDRGMVCISRDVTERRRQDERIRALQDATLRLTEATSVEEIGTVATDIASDLTGRELAAVWLFDPESERLEPLAFNSDATEFLEVHGHDLPSLGSNTAGMAAYREGKTIVSDDYQNAEWDILPLPIGSEIMSPIGDHGIFGVASHDVRPATDSDIHLVDIIARATAVSIEQVEREHAIESLHDVTRAMLQELDSAAICELAVDAFAEILDHPMCGVWLSERPTGPLVPVAHSEATTEMMDELPPLTADGGSLAWRAFDEGEIFVLPDADLAEDRMKTSVHSRIVIPLGEYGVLNVGSTQRDAFSDADVALVRLLASNTTVALDRAARERELAVQNDRLTFLNSLLRHDVLNGMTIIQGRAEFVTEDANDLGPEARRHLDTIVAWSDDIVTLVQRVRAMLDVLTGSGTTPHSVVELEPVLDEEVDRLVSTFSEVAIDVDIPPGFRIQADDFLGEVIGNVLTNAVRHNDTDTPQLSVSAERGDGTVEIRIADNGPGVPDELKEAIFRRNVTGHAKTSGSGFGLFFADTMVTQYGGEIRIEDNDPRGAVFVIELVSGKQNVITREDFESS